MQLTTNLVVIVLQTDRHNQTFRAREDGTERALHSLLFAACENWKILPQGCNEVRGVRVIERNLLLFFFLVEDKLKVESHSPQGVARRKRIRVF